MLINKIKKVMLGNKWVIIPKKSKKPDMCNSTNKPSEITL